MDKGPTDRRLSELGVSSVQFLLASALALVLFLALANLVVVQYGRGALRTALEQGARAGSVAVSLDDCEEMASHVVSQLLGGRMSDGLVISCEFHGDQITATGEAEFQSWTPLMPNYSVSLSAEAVLEVYP